MEHLGSVVGRFHPVVVHLPIGMLLLAFIFEILSLTDRYRKFRKAVAPALLFGALFAVVATITGLLLRQEGGYDEDLAIPHQILGILTTVFAFGLYYVRVNSRRFFPDRRKRRNARVGLFIPLVLLVSATGHLGGSLTHGESYLFPSSSTDEQIVQLKIDEPAQAKMYDDVIKPIFDARCYDCHSSRKQKGKLRLDNPSSIQRGGKNGPVIEGLPDSSLLFRALVLPIEDKKHMPPGEKPQLSSAEIDLIYSWLKSGANFEARVHELPDAEKAGQLIRSLQYSSKPVWIPEEDIEPASTEIILSLQRRGASVQLAAGDKNYLMINFTGVREIGVFDDKTFSGIESHVIWFHAGEHQLEKSHIDVISRFKNLRMLYLNNAGLDDNELKGLSALKALQYLNLTGNQVTDISLQTLAGLKDLEQLYLYQTDVSKEAIEKFMTGHNKISIDTGGYSLPVLTSDTIVYKRKIWINEKNDGRSNYTLPGGLSNFLPENSR